MGQLLNFPEATPAAPRYRIALLGPFALSRDGTPVDTGAWRPRALTLLRLLAAAPGLRRKREEVIDLLWPDSSPEAGSANLWDLARLVRRALPEDPSPVLLERGWVALNPACHWEVDLARFEALAAEAGDDPARLEAAASLVQGPILPDDRYADWAAPIRERVERRWHMLCLQLVERHRAAGAGERALAWAERLLEHDPLDEAALRQVLLLLDELGRRPEAERRYRRFADSLVHELGVAASPETEALAERIRRREARAEGGEAAPTAAAAPQAPAPAPPTNLPLQATSFVGRGGELAAVGDVLRREGVRLLTLTGPGGVGKTRLALQLAGGQLDRYADGVWLVELASLADPALVPQVVAAALGLREQPGRPHLETLLEALPARQMLLVLDNCEHLLDACAALASALLRTCPRLQILATSQEPLGLAGETSWRVPSLALPGAHEVPSLELVMASEAVQLFRDRAQAAQPQFRLTEESARVVAAICARLDGIPLAIELAAARVRALGLEALAARLDQRFRLLTGGSRAAPPRQQTLRAAVDWSYELLSEGERVLFERLAVFAGGWTLEAAEAVCAGEGIEAWEVLTLLDGLVGKSLVAADGAGGEMVRYRLLETLRQYGWERLEPREDAAAVRGRHAAFYLALAEEAEPRLTGHEQLVWLARLTAEQDNLRAALRWFLARGAAEEALRLAHALNWFWTKRGGDAEGYGWMERALALPGAPSVARVRALVPYAWSVMARGDTAAARRLLEEALQLGRRLGERAATARALLGLARQAIWQGDFPRARTLLEEGLVHYRALGDHWGVAEVLCNLGRVVNAEGDHALARGLVDEALATARGGGEGRQVAFALEVRGEVAFATGDYAEAGRWWAESLAGYRQVGVAMGVTSVENFLGQLAIRLGEYASARAHFRSSLEQQQGWRMWAICCLAGLAAVAAAGGRAEHALRLAGASLALGEGAGLRLPGPEQAALERAVEAARAALGEAAAAAAWAEGQALSQEAAVAMALEDPEAAPAGESLPLPDTLHRPADAVAVPEGERAPSTAAGTPAPRRSSTPDAGAAIPPPALPHYPPLQITSFVGRASEIAEVTGLLASTRLLTLTGTGGVGKTRLALQVAASLLDRYPDGIRLVELAPLADPALVPGTALAAVGVREQPGRPPLDVLLEALRTRRLLLVLDNCEHLLDACAHLAEALLHACPQLQILATSREPLGLAGETRWRVPSLSLPATDRHTSPDSLARCEAVQLFLDRARSVQPHFALTAANAPAVAAICARLDGIPLALELAAAQVRAIGVAALADRLDQRFRLLTGGSRTALPRQQTLRAAVEWSYDLLTERERTLFERLAVFQGGFTLEAAEAVCAGVAAAAGRPGGYPRAGDAAASPLGGPQEEDLAGEEMLDLLVRLVDKSLVVAEEVDGEVVRYRLLETIREYARERLAAGEAPDERAATHARHCGHYMAFLAGREAALKGDTQGPALAAIEGEIDNVRAAWQWAVAHGRAREIGQGAESLCLFYTLQGWFAEGEEALGRAAESLAREEQQTAGEQGDIAAVRGKVLAWQGRFCHWLARYERSVALLDESLALLRRGGAAQDMALCLDTQGSNAGIRGDYAAARRLYEESLALYAEAGDRYGQGIALLHLGGVAFDVGEFVEARDYWERGLALRSQGGHGDGMAHDLSNLGEVAAILGDYEEATRRSQESLALLREIGDAWKVIHPLANLGRLAEMRGSYEEARSFHRECLAISRRVGDGKGTALALLHLAQVALRSGEAGEAAGLYRESLQIFRDIDYPRGIAMCRNGLARLAARLGHHDEARQQGLDSLTLAQRIGARPEMADAHAVLGQVAYLSGDAAAAAEHVGAAARILLDGGALPALLDLLVDVAALLLGRGGDRAGHLPPEEQEWRQEEVLDALAVALQQPTLRGDTRARAERCLTGAVHPYSSESATRAQGLPLDAVVMRAIAAIQPRRGTAAGAD